VVVVVDNITLEEVTPVVVAVVVAIQVYIDLALR
jgi:hypothetical protein